MSKQKADYKVKVEFKENGKKRSKTLSLKKYNETQEFYLKNGNTLVRLEYKLNGELHREDGPAHVAFRRDGSVSSEYWYLNGKCVETIEFANYLGVDHYKSKTEEIYLKDGKLHREDGPATIYYNDDGSISKEYWYLNGEEHRENGPAEIEYGSDGSVECEYWFLNGERHRENGPSEIGYNSDGSIFREEWYLNGQQHRENGPAEIEYNYDGSISYEYWYLNGEPHREDEPALIYYNDDGSIFREEWHLNGVELPKEVVLEKLDYYKSDTEEIYLKDGKFHREDGPARIKYNDDGSISYEGWYLNGEPHREDEPALISYNDDGSIFREEWYLNGERHREDGPSEIWYNDDGGVSTEEWCVNGQHHREDGPAEISYNDDGSVSYEYWYLNGERHREDGPAWISYRDDGSVESEEWYLNGEQHRKDGPAEIEYNIDNGSVWREKWYLNGKELSIIEFAKHLDATHYKSEKQEVYLKDGKLHREDGPAIYGEALDSTRQVEQYYLEGKQLAKKAFFKKMNLDPEAVSFGMKIEEHKEGDVLHKTDGPALLKYDQKGTLLEESWYLNGKLHREDGPAYTKWTNKGLLKEKKFYNNGVMSNENHPSHIEYGTNEKLLRHTYYVDDEIHRSDNPAVIKFRDEKPETEDFYLNGEEVSIVDFANHLGVEHYKSDRNEVYLKDGKLHREDGPAHIIRRSSGSVKIEQWYSDGELHREKEPAFVEYHSDSSPKIYQWYQNGQQHRLDGPAYLQFESAFHYMNPSDVVKEEWYLNGEKTDEEAVNEERKKQKSTNADNEILEKHEYQIEVSNVFGRLMVWKVTKEQYDYWIKDNRFKELSLSYVPDGTPEEMNFQEDYDFSEAVGVDACDSSIVLYENTKDGQVEISDNLKGFRKSKEDIKLSDYGKYVFVRTSAMKGGQGSTFTTNGQIDITKLKFSTMHHRLLGEVFVGLSYDGEDLDFDGDWGEEKWWEVHLLKT